MNYISEISKRHDGSYIDWIDIPEEMKDEEKDVA